VQPHTRAAPNGPPAPRPRAGTNSYVLFTLDKLIMKVVKQMQVLLNDDLAAVRPMRPTPGPAADRAHAVVHVAGLQMRKSAACTSILAAARAGDCITHRVDALANRGALANTCCLKTLPVSRLSQKQ